MERGFTLIEMSLVVVVVGVLAVIAFVGYRRHRAAARMSEATQLITQIRSAQTEYKAETGVYANVSKNVDSFHPNSSPGRSATQWGSDCTACNEPQGWQRLKIHPETPVVFGYATVAGVGGSTTTVVSKPSEATLKQAADEQESTVKASDPFFIAVAKGDTDGDGVSCYVMGLSHTNHLVISNEGE
jgi:type IV pilus assembly protein PilA